MSQGIMLQKTIPKRILNSAQSSEDYSRSSAKRLFSTVFSIIDNDNEVTNFEEIFPPNNRITQLLHDQTFYQHLQLKIRSQSFYDCYCLPILKFSCHSNNKKQQKTFQSNYDAFQEKIDLDEIDLTKAFERFGNFAKIRLSLDIKEAYIFYQHFENAYIAFKLLKNLSNQQRMMDISLQFIRSDRFPQNLDLNIQTEILCTQWQQFQRGGGNNESTYYDDSSIYTKQTKLTCRYDIQIDNEKQFQVARRIIGSKGCNMKKIIEESVVAKTQNDLNQSLKLRLRGRGSGYKEGPQQQQSQENLHLCVSAKDQNTYNLACGRVQRLLNQIYADYLDFTKKQGQTIDLKIKRINMAFNSLPVEEIQIKTIESNQVDFENNSFTDLDNFCGYRITSEKISELLELRNKARRELNFLQADRIRNYLRDCGVCLIDEKGRRGKANEVTTWRYLY